MVTTLELKLLGEFELRGGNGRSVAVATRKNRALLAMLALSPSGSLPRERIVRLLWSDRGQVQAQASLRQALVALKKDLAGLGSTTPVSASDDRVSLDHNAVKVDVVEFQRLAGSNGAEALHRAVGLYRGELLSDIEIRDPAFERWLELERQRLSDVMTGVLEKLCALKTGAVRVEIAKRLVTFDPLRETSHRTLMAAYADAGERGLAMRQYEACCRLLKEELDVAPGDETEALRRRLSEDLISAARRSAENPAPSHETPALRGDAPTLAVLPFSVMSADGGLDEFSDGLTEDIITGLSRVRTLRVVARNTMFTYKHHALDVRALGRELAVRYVLEGSVRRSGARLRVTAQLIDAMSGHHVWAGKFDQQGDDTFDLQDRITAGVVASVQTQIVLSEGRAAMAGGASPESAGTLLARSWQQFLGLTEQSLADARSLAERALRLDPGSGLAHRVLSNCLYHQALMGFCPWTAQTIEEMHGHASIAIEAEDADEYSHWAMACAHLLRMEHERAVSSLRRALEINPNCSLAHGALGTVLAWAGQSQAAIGNNELAIRINPDDPANFFRRLGLSNAHFIAREYDQALVHASAVVQARPVWWLGLLFCAASLSRRGQRGEAARMLDELRRVRPQFEAASLDVLPFANPRDRQHLLDSLTDLGLMPAVASIVVAGA
jgi:TolB-like protein